MIVGADGLCYSDICRRNRLVSEDRRWVRVRGEVGTETFKERK